MAEETSEFEVFRSGSEQSDGAASTKEQLSKNVIGVLNVEKDATLLHEQNVDESRSENNTGVATDSTPPSEKIIAFSNPDSVVDTAVFDDDTFSNNLVSNEKVPDIAGFDDDEFPTAPVSSEEVPAVGCTTVLEESGSTLDIILPQLPPEEAMRLECDINFQTLLANDNPSEPMGFICDKMAAAASSFPESGEAIPEDVRPSFAYSFIELLSTFY